MLDTEDVVCVWNEAGNPAPRERLGRYARALLRDCPIGAYRSLRDDQEDRAMLALYRVDRPRATFADLHQMPALGLSSYHQLLHDLASAGLGPCECDSTNTDASTGTGSEEP
ncbi:MAG TPA: hypothetical protein VJQ61_10300 [Sinomonas sp.]|nr:hypothetical protein [Sinomonas sp.]